MSTVSTDGYSIVFPSQPTKSTTSRDRFDVSDLSPDCSANIRPAMTVNPVPIHVVPDCAWCTEELRGTPVSPVYRSTTTTTATAAAAGTLRGGGENSLRENEQQYWRPLTMCKIGAATGIMLIVLFVATAFYFEVKLRSITPRPKSCH